uniref:ABC transporter domain-containing protein n=1 Tax=Timema genevievae TaxID=629358 RepID=A0A7R9K2Y8_TIMGE|nr:unnamed protein product [Timema genevievae]
MKSCVRICLQAMGDISNICYRKNCDEVRVLPGVPDFFNRDLITLGRKKILHEICGRFVPSQLIAIMGPSGAGKSTLLDILSGYRISGVTGVVGVDGVERELDEFRRLSCYITQDDRLEPLLTVQESMRVAADLKLGVHVTTQEKLAIEVYPHLRGGTVGNHLWGKKNIINTSYRDSNPETPVIDSLVYCESDALDYTATGAGLHIIS